MAVVAFPTGYNLERSSTFKWDTGTEVDVLDDGSYAWRDMGGAYVTVNCKFNLLTESEADTLQDFVLDNANNYVSWTIDGTLYLGTFIGGPSRSMTGPRHNIAFKYYAAKFVI